MAVGASNYRRQNYRERFIFFAPEALSLTLSHTHTHTLSLTLSLSLDLYCDRSQLGVYVFLEQTFVGC